MGNRARRSHDARGFSCDFKVFHRFFKPQRYHLFCRQKWGIFFAFFFFKFWLSIICFIFESLTR